MSKRYTFTMIKKEGKLHTTNPAGMAQLTRNLEEGEELSVTFIKKKDEKTLSQLRTAYLLMGVIREHTGNTVTGLDLWVKQKMGKCWKEKVEGDEILECESKADFTKEEMEYYINILLELIQKYQIPFQLPS